MNMQDDALDVSDYLRRHMRTVPDWPAPGVQFRDITPLLQDPKCFRVLIDAFVHRYMDRRPDVVAGLDARGFILGAVVAYELGVGFVPIRKKGKLPHETVRIAYSLEYGVDEMEIHTDAIGQDERVILVDDLIATGGTAVAATKLLRQMGANIVAACFIIDLPDLGGAQKLKELGVEVRSLVSFEGH
jgi:adenine phosphoribosyltransferase